MEWRSRLTGFLLLCSALMPISFPLPVEAHSDAQRTIRMIPDGFEPSSIEIHVGDTVVFQNDDVEYRWPASNIHPTHTAYPGSGIEKCDTEEEKNLFDACRDIAPGGTYEFTFSKPGIWTYHDHEMPDFVGKIVVIGEENEAVDEEIPTQHRSIRERFVAWFQGLQHEFVRAYYALRPSALEARLEHTDLFVAAANENSLRLLLSEVSPESVMKDLLADSVASDNRDCHQEAHLTGRVAYEMFGARVFEKGNATCHSGFYHGAMEAFLAEHGTDRLSEKITALCRTFPTRFGVFECLHGVGHGVMAYVNYDLPEALRQCGLLATDFQTQSCYGGAFMENIVAGQGLGAIPGHDTAWVKKDDPNFPCNAIDQDSTVQYECYMIQTSWTLFLNDSDFVQAAEHCKTAPAELIPVCFQSLGRDAAGLNLRDKDKIVTICQEISSGALYERCIIGGLNVIIDFWGSGLKDQAAELCERVPEADAKRVCTETLESRKASDFSKRKK